jgi:hypothetical protein
MVSVINISGQQVFIDTMRTMLKAGDRINLPMTLDEVITTYPDLTILASRKHIILAEPESKHEDKTSA